MAWFRFYHEALDDPKVQRLTPTLFKAWVNLLCLAARKGGRLPSVDDIAFSLRASVNDAQQYIDELILLGLLDISPKGDVTPHNWQGRQYKSDSSAERTRKYRKRLNKAVSDGGCDVTCDALEQNRTEQSRAETEQTDSDAERSSARDGRLSDGLSEQNFIDCKSAFNGNTEAMLAEVAGAMHPYGDRPQATQWLSTVLRANGHDAVAQAFTMLQTARAEGKAIARPLSWLAKTAATLKADGVRQKPQLVDRAAAKREADLAYLRSIGAM